jgi:CBS domain-containing protein
MTWTVSDVMTRNVGTPSEPMTAGGVTTTGGTSLAVAASLMFQHHATELPVVDSQNRLVGTVSRSQVLKAFLRRDPSIQKEIRMVLGKPESAGRGNVEAEVVRGVVHLHGEVDSEAAVAQLVRLVAGVPGVVGVESHLNLPGETGLAPTGESRA